MEISPTNFKTEFRETLLAFLWRQWSALGVSGYGRTDDPWLIDPEALLLFSTVVGRQDARLFDEILDWLQLNAGALNLQRLARLHREHALGDATVLAAIAAQLTRGKAHPKWRAIAARTAAPLAATAPRPLFPHLPTLGRGDPIWLAWGWHRPAVDLRGHSLTPRPDQPATFLFKLRSLFGLQTRAEIIAWLLAHETGHPAEIARATAYFRSSVQGVLNELAASGHIFSLRVGREKRFGLRHDDWRFLASWKNPAGNFPRWLPWAPIFRILIDADALLHDSSLATASAELQAIEWRRRLDYSPLSGTDLPATFSLPISARGPDAVDAHHDRLRALVAWVSAV